MNDLTRSRDALALGLVLGAVFSVLNVISAYMAPLEDDTLPALAAFYGPMFVAWGVAGFLASRRSERITDGVKAGTLVALATFIVLTIVVIVRVNLSLSVVSQRPDWRNLVARFESSGFSSLRTYVNYIYLTGAPFKIFVATSIGALFGFFGGCTSLLSAAARLQFDEPAHSLCRVASAFRRKAVAAAEFAQRFERCAHPSG